MIKINSLNSKIFLSFFILGIFLLSLFFLQVIPQMNKEEKKHTIKQIENMIYLTNQQIKLVMRSKKNNGEIRKEELKSIIEHEAIRITNRLNLDNSISKIEDKSYQFSSKKITCNTSILNSNKHTLFQLKDESFKEFKDELKDSTFLRRDIKNKYICSTGIRKLYYTKKIKKHNKFLVISCDIDNFSTKGEEFELKLKKEIQKSFSLLDSFHKGKAYLMWLNPNIKDDKPLYSKEDRYLNEKYCLSKISNFTFPKTGDLTPKEIIQAIDKEPINHLLNGKKSLTWVKSINLNKDEYFLYLVTIYEKDFLKHLGLAYMSIIPAAIISFFIAIVVALIIFNRLFKSINILKNVAFKVNKGEKNIRSNIKGKDDIAVLAKAFDNMLDSLEENISLLDKKVEIKTKLLSDSLKEKETLLKEIHHRVKNNLAITIDLIKLEKSKIKDKKTKDTLTNIQEKIFVMELLHRKLYESKDLNLIPLKNFIEDICQDLTASYFVEEKISINTDIEQVYMNIDYALPLGLIITELITNSFKYAFKDKGEIFVSLKKSAKKYILEVKDNGKGLDENIDVNNTKTLGFQIISNITKGQLSSKLEYFYEKGANFQIIFEIKR